MKIRAGGGGVDRDRNRIKLKVDVFGTRYGLRRCCCFLGQLHMVAKAATGFIYVIMINDYS